MNLGASRTEEKREKDTLKADESISFAGSVLPVAPFEIWTSQNERVKYGGLAFCVRWNAHRERLITSSLSPCRKSRSQH